VSAATKTIRILPFLKLPLKQKKSPFEGQGRLWRTGFLEICYSASGRNHRIIRIEQLDLRKQNGIGKNISLLRGSRLPAREQAPAGREGATDDDATAHRATSGKPAGRMILARKKVNGACRERGGERKKVYYPFAQGTHYRSAEGEGEERSHPLARKDARRA